jgi:hypothetical protein
MISSDSYVMPACILIKSIKDESRDKIAIVTPNIGEYSQEKLKAFGWKLKVIETIQNKNQMISKRFQGKNHFTCENKKKIIFL